MRVALYARYSSDQPRESSIADQLRDCRALATREGWTVVREYHDSAMSGASRHRPGLQSLLLHAGDQYDIVIAESLDRLSRDQEDTAAVHKRLAFVGVRIITLAEGEISHLHVGFKGTMNALFLKDLADKTRRGLRGRVEAGKSGAHVQQQMTELLGKKADLAATIVAAERAQRARPLLHPEMGKLYREWVIDARDGLRDPDRRTDAMTALRAMVEEIVLTPEQGKLGIVLKGDLAAMLAAASPRSNSEDLQRQVKLVAGA